MDNKKNIKYEKHFWSLHSELRNVGATYVSFLIFDEDNQVIYSQSNNNDWTQEFTSTKIYQKCHLLNSAQKQLINCTKPFTLLWDMCDPITDEAKTLESIRAQKNISHGVGFCISNNQNKLFLNIAGKYVDLNFGFNVLKTRKKIYKDIYNFILSTL